MRWKITLIALVVFASDLCRTKAFITVLPRPQSCLTTGSSARQVMLRGCFEMSIEAPPGLKGSAVTTTRPAAQPPAPKKVVKPPTDDEDDNDVMWKVKVDPADMLALADRTLDTIEDATMHLRRVFSPPASTSISQSPDEDRMLDGVKPRIVVLGTGWGGHALSKVIDVDKYEVIYVSPRNYFIFTPLLAAASVGTVDVRSITESIRMANPCVKYVQGEVVDIQPGEKTVGARTGSKGLSHPPQPLPYTRLHYWGKVAIAHASPERVDVGPMPSTDIFGGDMEEKPKENSSLMHLKYDKLVYAVGTKTGTFGVKGVKEHCYMLKEAQDARLLRGAIVDRLEEACLPGVTEEDRERLLAFVVIGSGPTGIEFTGELTDLISTDVPRLFPELVGKVSVTLLSADGVVLPMFDEVLQDRGLKQLNAQGIDVMLGQVAAEVTPSDVVLKSGKHVPYGLCFWAGGTEPRALTKKIIKKIGAIQTEAEGSRRGQLTVDSYLRVLGTNGTIIALGDAAKINGTMLPSTGQVAAQEGAYVARLLNRGYNTSVEEAPTV
ncbi:unnamed protein product, partial [Choristocarpus tenellus]